MTDKVSKIMENCFLGHSFGKLRGREWPARPELAELVAHEDPKAGPGGVVCASRCRKTLVVSDCWPIQRSPSPLAIRSSLSRR